MIHWIVWALLALITWGFWGLFPKLAIKYISPNSAVFYEALGAAICGILLALCFGGKPEVSTRGAIFAGLTGVTAILGGWFYLYAAREANISVVVVLTALYPIMTVLLAYAVLGETITTRQIFAMLLAIAAIVLLVSEQANTGNVEPSALVEPPPQQL